jgi:hypothetical protein
MSSLKRAHPDHGGSMSGRTANGNHQHLPIAYQHNVMSTHSDVDSLVHPLQVAQSYQTFQSSIAPSGGNMSFAHNHMSHVHSHTHLPHTHTPVQNTNGLNHAHESVSISHSHSAIGNNPGNSFAGQSMPTMQVFLCMYVCMFTKYQAHI